ncbi:N-lysine methyltransferase SMYD2-like isoform X2 [Paramacrobiotus metropolitanus]|uniref:N-lysine methyltransferase SMYD2-like isoform X2 n=1 Tax=Paramacrobiotus metropolitanus TaxID=2943436 RepID=UPI002445FF02|nr:N-lysine methyltransferase SMYD2-like isoform X2 [Paramacrobiotus metropolitanus]
MAVHTKSYQAGDVVFRSEPWVYCILASKSHFHCYHCFSPGALHKPADIILKKCSGCYFAHYCSIKCQKTDWTKRHRPECKMLYQVGLDADSEVAQHLDRLLILAKILPKLQRGEVEQKLPEECTPSSTRSFYDLMSHEQNYLKQRPDLREAYRILKPYLNLINPDSNQLCGDYISFISILGRFNINSFFIYTLQSGVVAATGRGLYLGPSVLDHSCIPNAMQTEIGIQLVIKAVTDIDCFENVRIAYTSPFEIPENRTAYLEKHYFFICACAACVNDNELAKRDSVACSGSPECSQVIPGDLNLTSFRCPNCGVDNVQQLTKAAGIVLDLKKCIKDCENNCNTAQRLSRCRKLEEQVHVAQDVLHNTNFTLGVACKVLSEMLQSIGAPTDVCIPYLLKCLPSRRLYAKDYSLSKYVAIFEWMLRRNSLHEAKAFAEDIERELRTIPGKESPVYYFWQSHTSTINNY